MKLWQKCPICGGCGQVSGGFFDSPGSTDEYGNHTWVSASAVEMCKVCQGQGIIQTPEQDNGLEVEGWKL